MLPQILVDDVTYTAKDEPLKLLMVLRRHLDDSLDEPQRINLSDVELLTLKSWLLLHAESMRAGKAMWVEESVDGRIYKLVAAIGKALTVALLFGIPRFHGLSISRTKVKKSICSG